MVQNIYRKVKAFINTEDRKRLLSNFFSLSILQGANYILPLITLPYLVRVLGPEKYGLIAFAQAFIQYFNILTDYGFNLSATREISIHRENKEKIAEIFSSVMIIKFALLILSFIIMTVIVFSFEKFRKDWLVYYLTFGIVVGQVLFPVWYFQGMERMKYITVLNITAKLIFTVSIFIFVHSVSDYIYVPLLNSLGFCMAGILAWYFVFKEVKTFKILKNKLIVYLKLSTPLFFSNISITMFNNSITFLGGILFDYKMIGYYTSAEKLFIAIRNLYGILFQSIFPYFSRKKSIKIKTYFIISAIISFVVSYISFLLSEEIICMVYGYPLHIVIYIFKLLSISLFFCGINIIFYTNFFLSKGLYKMFSVVVFISGLFSIFILFIFSKVFAVFALPLSILLTEIFLLVLYTSIFLKLLLKNNSTCHNII